MLSTLPRGNAVTFDYGPEHRLEENFHLLDYTHSPSHGCRPPSLPGLWCGPPGLPDSLYSVWPVMRHLLYAPVNGISDSVLLPEHQHFSASFAPYNLPSEAALSITTIKSVNFVSQSTKIFAPCANFVACRGSVGLFRRCNPCNRWLSWLSAQFSYHGEPRWIIGVVPAAAGKLWFLSRCSRGGARSGTCPPPTPRHLPVPAGRKPSSAGLAKLERDVKLYFREDAESPAGRPPASAGRMPEWTKGADCKSAIRGFESHSGLYGESYETFYR